MSPATEPLTPQQWRNSGDYLTFDSLRIFTRVEGQGPPVLVLHGFPTSSYDFSRVAQSLAQTSRLIFFDYPGYGFSAKPWGYLYSLFGYADAAEQVARHYAIDRVSILAHDIGDSVALELMRRGNLHIERLIMMNGSVHSIPFDDLKLRTLQKMLLNPVIGPLTSYLRLITKRRFASTFRPIFYGGLPDADLDVFWSIMMVQNGIRNYHALMQYMPERWAHQETWLTALETHPAPLTLIWGQNDPIATPAVADVVTARRPDAVDHRLERVGHYPQWEAPERVIPLIGQALDRQPHPEGGAGPPPHKAGGS